MRHALVSVPLGQKQHSMLFLGREPAELLACMQRSSEISSRASLVVLRKIPAFLRNSLTLHAKQAASDVPALK